MDNPYLFLNLNPDCTDDELETRYLELKMRYSEDRFLEGEAGRFGAENLTRLEECYSEIKRQRAAQPTREGGDDLETIDLLIKDGRLDEAQTALDAQSARGGRWHYLQAIVFYKRSWFTDSLRQLDIALSLEPDNAQYRHSREMLQRIVDGGQQSAHAGAPAGQGGPAPQPTPQPDDAMGMATCCQTLCCADCLCNTMRCFGCG